MLFGIYLRSGELPGARRTIRDAWRRGRRAAWLPAQDWEALLPRRLDDVRGELALGASPVYQPVRSAGAPAVGA
jgi:ubiquinone biosynthesis protein COQ4